MCALVHHYSNKKKNIVSSQYMYAPYNKVYASGDELRMTRRDENVIIPFHTGTHSHTIFCVHMPFESVHHNAPQCTTVQTLIRLDFGLKWVCANYRINRWTQIDVDYYFIIDCAAYSALYVASITLWYDLLENKQFYLCNSGSTHQLLLILYVIDSIFIGIYDMCKLLNRDIAATVGITATTIALYKHI